MWRLYLPLVVKSRRERLPERRSFRHGDTEYTEGKSICESELFVTTQPMLPGPVPGAACAASGCSAYAPRPRPGGGLCGK